MFSIGTTWNKICETRYDPESQLFALLTSCGKYLVPDDLKPLIMDVVETHPGLEFLRSAPEFHSRYVTTLGKFISFRADDYNLFLFLQNQAIVRISFPTRCSLARYETKSA